MAEANNKQIGTALLDFGFEAQMPEIARLVRGIPNDPSLSRSRNILFDNYSKPYFMCMNLEFLGNRGSAIARAIKAHRMLAGAKLDRRIISAVSNGFGLSLQQILKVNSALILIRNHSEESVRILGETSSHSRIMEEDSVILSNYWVDKYAVKEFRKNLPFSREELSGLLFGTGDVARRFFYHLHEGDVTKDKKKLHYRVSECTAEAISFLFDVTAHYFGGEASLPPPPFGQLFDNGLKAGPNSGKNTTVFPFSRGNLRKFLTGEEKLEIIERVEASAISRGQSFGEKFTF